MSTILDRRKESHSATRPTQSDERNVNGWRNPGTLQPFSNRQSVKTFGEYSRQSHVKSCKRILPYYRSNHWINGLTIGYRMDTIFIRHFSLTEGGLQCQGPVRPQALAQALAPFRRSPAENHRRGIERNDGMEKGGNHHAMHAMIIRWMNSPVNDQNDHQMFNHSTL